MNLRMPALLRSIAVVLAMTVATPVFAQQAKPVMENVFYNVLWGSATGAIIGSAAAVIAAKDKNNPPGLRSGAFQGATLGGIVGLGVGVWLVFSGITIDPSSSLLGDNAMPPRDPTEEKAVAMASPPPLPVIALEFSEREPARIIGFRATLVDMKF